MTLAVSNLAWESKDANQVLSGLQKLGITHIEGVPTKISDWNGMTTELVGNFNRELANYNINVVSMQSIFYQSPCINLGDVELVLSHFSRVLNCSSVLGTKTLVFGSPQLRKRVTNWQSILIELFRKLDYILEASSTIVVVEPNAGVYGGEYFITVEEIVEFIKQNNLKNIKTMIDTHNILLENQDPIVVFQKYFPYIHHIHISEVGLKPIHNLEFHRSFAKMIHQSNYTGVVTYELFPCEELLREIQVFLELYNKTQ